MRRRNRCTCHSPRCRTRSPLSKEKWALQWLSEFGHRTEVVAGDFFEALPAGDLYLLKMVLHGFDSSRCIEILQRCREAMSPGGTKSPHSVIEAVAAT